jgi:UDP-N-acetylmuramoylalanine--D-glutamate ligase
MKILNLKQKIKVPVVVVGLGKSGLAAERFLITSGFLKTDVYTFDEKADSQLKSWEQIQNLTPGTLVVSPGVPLQSANVQNLKKLGWEITSEINLACTVLTDEIVIGITGSVGKSTVTSILGAGAITEDQNAFIGGNLGTPFCEYAISLLEKRPKARYVILELSSYQLENCSDLKLKFSAITYLSANHLERYVSLDQYYLTKCQIGQVTTGLCVLNSASADLMKYKNQIPGQSEVTTIQNQKINLIGKHNLENYFVAATLAEKCGWNLKSFQAMQEFPGLAHRLETVGLFKGILFINDSKATAMDSVLVAVGAALEQTKNDSKLFLLLGGKDKNLPWEQLQVLAVHKNIQIVFFGQCGQIAHDKSQLQGNIFKQLSQALSYIFQQARSSDVVLLSPGGTSLDEFKNFEERGNVFKEIAAQHYSIK